MAPYTAIRGLNESSKFPLAPYTAIRSLNESSKFALAPYTAIRSLHESSKFALAPYTAIRGLNESSKFALAPNTAIRGLNESSKYFNKFRNENFLVVLIFYLSEDSFQRPEKQSRLSGVAFGTLPIISSIFERKQLVVPFCLLNGNITSKMI